MEIAFQIFLLLFVGKIPKAIHFWNQKFLHIHAQGAIIQKFNMAV
jgi:hypothetical protein